MDVNDTFVGREKERQFFTELLGSLSDRLWRRRNIGEPSLLIIHGHGGIGKSALIGRLEATARQWKQRHRLAHRKTPLLVARLDWESVRARHAQDFKF